ncbi:MAG: VWA domain-containing protein [Ruminococcus sp.]|nr:VWA domain-containing protein [Ruminococcus sp.]
MKKFITVLTTIMVALFQTHILVMAESGTQPLQVYFSDDGKTMNIFLSETLDENSEILIGGETLPAEVKNTDIQVRTVFLIDNSTSMPAALRDELKNAIRSYVSSMPANETVKIASFDTDTEILADEFSNDSEFIDYELSKVPFDGQASLVYDALLNIINSSDESGSFYNRTVLITDGIDSVGGTSFDFLRTEIDENSRYHVDVVQVNKNDTEDVNLKAIASLGSNTYTFFSSGSDLSSLVTPNVSMMKVQLTGTVTTGELKGVTIKNGSQNIQIGSVLFPQVEIPTEPPTEVKTAPVTEAPTTVVTTTTAEPEKNEDSGKLSTAALIAIIGGGVLLAAGAVTFIIIMRKKKKNSDRVVFVRITKDSHTDQTSCGDATWSFAPTGEFRVGREAKPVELNGTALPVNDMVICETESSEYHGSIGRNAFALRYDCVKKAVMLTNTAKKATFSVVKNGTSIKVGGGQSVELEKGMKIELGSYTDIEILKIKK